MATYDQDGELIRERRGMAGWDDSTPIPAMNLDPVQPPPQGIFNQFDAWLGLSDFDHMMSNAVSGVGEGVSAAGQSVNNVLKSLPVLVIGIGLLVAWEVLNDVKRTHR